METITYHSYEVHYKTSGDPSNPCIVCLHPAFGDHRVFEDQLSGLSESYFIIAPDMIGHGLTQPKSTSDQIDETIHHVRQILDYYQIQHCHLLGVSLGSLVVQGFAHTYPERTLSVTVVGGYSIHKNNQKIIKTQNREIFSWIFKLMFNMNAFRRYIAAQSTYLPDAYERMLTYSQATTRKSMTFLRGMGNLFINSEKPVPYPLWIVYGEKDLPLALEHGQEWVELEPNAKLSIIKNAGHCANMEQPETFNLLYQQFLNQ